MRSSRMPRHVHAFIDKRSGGAKARYYLRRPGHKAVPLPGLPWSPEFMQAYENAMAGQMPIEIGAKRTLPGSINALAVMYLNSAAFRSLAPSTQKMRRYLVERFRVEHGDKRYALLQHEHVLAMRDKIEQPAVARSFLQTIRALMAFAVEAGLIKKDPTHDVKSVVIKSDGLRTWTEDEIAIFEAAHPIGCRARLALELFVCTGQRCSDVAKMGWQNVRDGAIHFRQDKTGARLEIPIMPGLQTALNATPRDRMTFLVVADIKGGTPFSAKSLGDWFVKMRRKAGLPNGLSAHGLRKACARRLAEAGCSAHEIASITGHASLKEVERYTKAADQRGLARRAIATMTASLKR